MLVFSMRVGSFNDESLMEFITELRELLEGDKATLIWDGLTSHRSRAMNQFLKTQRH
jgi:DNA-binding GntR family transcriptional regulator